MATSMNFTRERFKINSLNFIKCDLDEKRIKFLSTYQVSDLTFSDIKFKNNANYF